MTEEGLFHSYLDVLRACLRPGLSDSAIRTSLQIALYSIPTVFLDVKTVEEGRDLKQTRVAFLMGKLAEDDTFDLTDSNNRSQLRALIEELLARGENRLSGLAGMLARMEVKGTSIGVPSLEKAEGAYMPSGGAGGAGAPAKNNNNNNNNEAPETAAAKAFAKPNNVGFDWDRSRKGNRSRSRKGSRKGRSSRKTRRHRTKQNRY